MPKKKEQPKGKSSKREPKYDESPEIPLDKITEEYDNLRKISEVSLRATYRRIFHMRKGRRMTSIEVAQASIICDLISDNNINLLALFEDKLGIKFLG